MIMKKLIVLCLFLCLFSHTSMAEIELVWSFNLLNGRTLVIFQHDKSPNNFDHRRTVKEFIKINLPKSSDKLEINTGKAQVDQITKIIIDKEASYDHIWVVPSFFQA